MNSSDEEAASLRKQIQFLERLISSAEVKKTKPGDGRNHALNQPVSAQFYRSKNISGLTSQNASTNYRAGVKSLSCGESREAALNQTVSSQLVYNKLKHSSFPTYRNTSIKHTADIKSPYGYGGPKEDLDQTFSSQYIKSKHSSDFPSRNTSAKYTWKRDRLEDGSQSYNRLSSMRRNGGPYSKPSDSNHSSKVDSQSEKSSKSNLPQAKDDNQIALNVHEACSSSNVKAKSKSQFTWNKDTVKEKNIETHHLRNTYQSKKSDTDRPTGCLNLSDLSRVSDIHKTMKITDCDQSNIHDRTSLPQREVRVKNAENVQSLPYDKPPQTDSLKYTKSNSSKTDSTTSGKHLSLQNEILKTQSKLECWKKNLLIKRMKSQITYALDRDKHKTNNTQPKFSNTSVHPRHKTVKRYHPYHYNSTFQQPFHQYSHSYKKYGKPWLQTYTSVGWNSKYYPRKLHQAFNFMGRYAKGVQNRKYKNGPRSRHLYSVSIYPGRGFGLARNNFNFNKTMFNRYKYGLISKVDIRRRIDRVKRLRDEVPFDPKMKLDRREQEGRKKRQKFVIINGMLYKTSQKSLIKAAERQCVPSHASAQSGASSRVKFMNSTAMKTLTVRGVKFKVDRDGKSLKRFDSQQSEGANLSAHRKGSSSVSRVDIGGVTYRQTKPGTLERVATRKTSLVAKKVLSRTMAQVTTRHKKDNTKMATKQQYCVFYNRFGKCNRKEKCPFIHDPDRIAICTRFLRGTCKIKACPFSHKVSQEKMPVCSYFLKGVCNKVDCPYLHVNVNKDAEICQDFVNGFCSRGKKCTKKHTLVCPVFAKTGTCPEGKSCRLQHRRSKHRKQSGSGLGPDKVGNEKHASSVDLHEKEIEKESEDMSLSFKDRRLPAYISLKSKPIDNLKKDESKLGTSICQNKDTSVMKIRPQL